MTVTRPDLTLRFLSEALRRRDSAEHYLKAKRRDLRFAATPAMRRLSLDLISRAEADLSRKQAEVDRLEAEIRAAQR